MANALSNQDLTARNTDGTSTFAAEDYFVGLAQQIVVAHKNTRVSLPGNGEICILPGRGEYFTNVSDFEKFCQAPVDSFRNSPLTDADISTLQAAGHAKSLRNLFWDAAFHASQGRLIAKRSNGEAVHVSDVVQLRYWPNLTRLATTPNSMRVCALLTQYPSSIMLVARRLRIEPAEVFQIYSAACCGGLVKIYSSNLVENEPDPVSEPIQEQPQSQNLLRLLFKKLSGI